MTVERSSSVISRRRRCWICYWGRYNHCSSLHPCLEIIAVGVVANHRTHENRTVIALNSFQILPLQIFSSLVFLTRGMWQSRQIWPSNRFYVYCNMGLWLVNCIFISCVIKGGIVVGENFCCVQGLKENATWVLVWLQRLKFYVLFTFVYTFSIIMYGDGRCFV